jgi:putative RNA 2'-phosphotransferase
MEGGNDMSDVRTSKFISKVLRHEPKLAGVTLDEFGWVLIDDLINGSIKAGVPLTRDSLASLINPDGKVRLEVDPTGTLIRACQGHSVPVTLGLAPSTPPPVLFHGTVQRALEAIRVDGLLPMKRQLVHLSKDEETASIVGSRRGEAVILIVDAAAMSAAGFLFTEASNGVWLTERVPARFLTFPT